MSDISNEEENLLEINLNQKKNIFDWVDEDIKQNQHMNLSDYPNSINV